MAAIPMIPVAEIRKVSASLREAGRVFVTSDHADWLEKVADELETQKLISIALKEALRSFAKRLDPPIRADVIEGTLTMIEDSIHLRSKPAINT